MIYHLHFYQTLMHTQSKDGDNSTSGMMEEVSTPLNEACQALGKLVHNIMYTV